MKTGGKKLYSLSRPAHPDDAHTKAKRFFKKKGRKKARKYLKHELTKEISE
jgi:hypothetical protein